MSESIKNKIRFYLDQNVIDYLIKGNLDAVQQLINQTPNSEILYSYVTLREFAHIKDITQRKIYLDYLKRVNAKYLRIDKDELAYFEAVDPFEKFYEYINDSRIAKEIEDPMLDMVHKLFGGKKDVSFEGIAISQKNSFSHLMEHLDSSINTLDQHPAIDKELLKKYSQSMNSYFAELIDRTVQQLKDKNYNNENPLNDLRR